MNNPINCSDPSGLDPRQFGLAVGGSVIAPGIGGSVFGVVGLNYDGMKSSVYAQLQQNLGLGGGAFVGWGGSLLGGSGPNSAPSTGISSAGYLEADAGYGPAGSVSGNIDSNGNITGYSGTVPYKLGVGFGAGVFGGVSYTQTAVSPSLQNIANAFTSFFTSSQSSSTSAANGGFVLYPNKSNTNQMQSVYKK